MDSRYSRALIFLEQSRHSHADAELRRLLASDPDDSLAHSLLALCLLAQEKFQEATDEARLAIGLTPDSDYAHFVHAQVLEKRNHYSEAEQAIREALSLDPLDADYHGLLATIKFNQGKWPESLMSAEKGLELDAENDTCLNLRAMALVKLGRKKEAGEAIEGALSRDPENAVTHANMGWTLLHQNKPKQALDHFREALRLDPNLEWAREGVVQALKARHLVYRLLLAYFLWTSSLGAGARWMIMLGGWFGYRFFYRVAKANPDQAVFIAPILIAYVVFALLTWLGSAVFSMVLWFNRYGRLALSDDSRAQAKWMAGIGSIAAGTLCIDLWRQPWSFPLGSLLLFLIVIPVVSIYDCPKGWPRQVMAAATCAMAAILLAILFGWYAGVIWEQEWVAPVLPLLLWAVPVYSWGVLLSQLLANYLMQVNVRR